MNENNAPNFDLEYNDAVGTTEAPAPVTPDTLPEKYSGKSLEDIISMHQNAERLIAKQGRDLAEQRRLTDSILELKKENAPAPEPVTYDELVTDPNAALNKAVEQSSVARKVDSTESRLNQVERSLGQREFESRFPTIRTDIQDPQFIEWVGKNKARAGLLAGLHNNWDFDAGTALWEMWEEHKSVVQPQADAARRAAATAASTVRNSANEASSRPVYSRSKLLALQERAERGDQRARSKWNDPAFQAERLAAYQEGRVK